MAKKEKRFHVIKAGDDSLSGDAQIWIDKVTGVNYLYIQHGYGGGLTPLLDRDGRVIVSTLPLSEE